MQNQIEINKFTYYNSESNGIQSNIDDANEDANLSERNLNPCTSECSRNKSTSSNRQGSTMISNTTDYTQITKIAPETKVSLRTIAITASTYCEGSHLARTDQSVATSDISEDDISGSSLSESLVTRVEEFTKWNKDFEQFSDSERKLTTSRGRELTGDDMTECSVNESSEDAVDSTQINEQSHGDKEYEAILDSHEYNSDVANETPNEMYTTCNAIDGDFCTRIVSDNSSDSNYGSEDDKFFSLDSNDIHPKITQQEIIPSRSLSTSSIEQNDNNTHSSSHSDTYGKYTASSEISSFLSDSENYVGFGEDPVIDCKVDNSIFPTQNKGMLKKDNSAMVCIKLIIYIIVIYIHILTQTYTHVHTQTHTYTYIYTYTYTHIYIN